MTVITLATPLNNIQLGPGHQYEACQVSMIPIPFSNVSKLSSTSQGSPYTQTLTQCQVSYEMRQRDSHDRAKKWYTCFLRPPLNLSDASSLPLRHHPPRHHRFRFPTNEYRSPRRQDDTERPRSHISRQHQHSWFYDSLLHPPGLAAVRYATH